MNKINCFDYNIDSFQILLKYTAGRLPGGPLVKNPPGNTEDTSLIFDQRTRSYRATKPDCLNY